jgi:hypothetical protein
VEAHLDRHDFCRTAKPRPECFLHRVDPLVAIARHLNVYRRITNTLIYTRYVEGITQLCGTTFVNSTEGTWRLTGSDFDRLWSESPVDVVDEYVPLLFCQVQPIQDGRISERGEGGTLHVNTFN